MTPSPTADRTVVHLVRHGEVHNPDRVLYGRLPEFHLSALGRELDSLADVISFGVGPAALGFAAGLTGGWDAAALIYFVCCGVSRLARYNVTAETLSAGAAKVKYFEGTPIPTSILLVILLALLHQLDLTRESFPLGAVLILGKAFHPFSLLYFLSGSLMISTVRVPKP